MIPLRNRFPINVHRVFPRSKLWFSKLVKEIPWSKPHVFVFKTVLVGVETYHFIEWWEWHYSIKRR